MTDLKRITPQKILWLDLEMTGLNPTKDRILEVAAIITTWDFIELGVFESGVGHSLKDISPRIESNDFYKAWPQHKQALMQLASTSPDEPTVVSKLLAFIHQHCEPNEVLLLAGNSIHADRGFIRQWWPEVDSLLHYRMLDVSAWKVVMAGVYGVQYNKKESHRALEDIRESIGELKFYLQKGSWQHG